MPKHASFESVEHMKHVLGEEARQQIQGVESQLAQIAYQVPLNATTTEIQNALNSRRKLLFLDGEYIIDTPLFVSSNTQIEFSPSTVFKAAVGSFPNANDVMWTFKSTENVKLLNKLKIIMNKEEYTTGEWRNGLSLLSVKNFEADTIEVFGSGGDGVYFGRDRDALDIELNENIKIKNIIVDNNRRNGVSFICGKNIFIDTIIAKNTSGTDPQYGVDFEPNYNTELLQNIVINNIYTENNKKGGLVFAIGKLRDATEPTSITVNNFNSVNDGSVGALRFAYNNLDGDTNQLSGFIKVKGYILNPKGKGVDFYNYSSKSVHVDVEVIVENPGQDINSSTTGDLSGFHMQTFSGETAQKVGNFTLRNCKAIDTRVTKRMSIPFYLPSTQKLIEKVEVIDPIGEGQTNLANGIIHIGKGSYSILKDNLDTKELSGSVTVTNYQSMLVTNPTTSAIVLTLPKSDEYTNSVYHFKKTTGIIQIRPNATDKINMSGKTVGEDYVMRKTGDYIVLRSNGADGWDIVESVEQVWEWNTYTPNYIGQISIVSGIGYIATGLTVNDWKAITS